LAGLVRRIDKNISVATVQTSEDMNQAMESL